MVFPSVDENLPTLTDVLVSSSEYLLSPIVFPAMLCLLDVRGRPMSALTGRCGEVVGGEPGGEERAMVLGPSA